MEGNLSRARVYTITIKDREESVERVYMYATCTLDGFEESRAWNAIIPRSTCIECNDYFQMLTILVQVHVGICIPSTHAAHPGKSLGNARVVQLRS